MVLCTECPFLQNWGVQVWTPQPFLTASPELQTLPIQQLLLLPIRHRTALNTWLARNPVMPVLSWRFHSRESWRWFRRHPLIAKLPARLGRRDVRKCWAPRAQVSSAYWSVNFHQACTGDIQWWWSAVALWDSPSRLATLPAGYNSLLPLEGVWIRALKGTRWLHVLHNKILVQHFLSEAGLVPGILRCRSELKTSSTRICYNCSHKCVQSCCHEIGRIL